ncbi:uncharacterized protein LOC108484896 [Gossypium arboreum]|uniref:MULE transposase domain-containing protein n=1 Tax=Gossypium arboreum TaxID=29729 RepID=A0ABR0QKS4_GOSAR|nr:uncharacterized protein LOC108484896 [Gossypium arboreum]KAK5839552.1 hypothetical protein PVK06_008353 [Gossypium arboreum]
MTNNGEDSNQDVEDFSDSDVDEVPDDIDDEGPEKVEDVHGLLFNNPSRDIILRNKLEGDMLNVDPDAGYASEFLVYADIVRAHRLAVNSQFEELFVGQQFEYKANCVFAIKLYNMKLSIDYKVVKSTPTLYVRECWRGGDRCGWRVRAAFIQTTQQWQIRKLEGHHTCTVARMSQDHQKLDAKSICNYIMLLVKDSLIILVSTLIADIQARFQYRVSYRKAWAFPHCKPLVQVDGTWLYGKYTQILLIAVAQDGNGNVLPIAFAIMESENSESWTYFIQNLWRHAVRQDNICIISDRSKGLVAAIRQSEVPWRSVYCIRHITINFHNEYKNKD